MLLVLVGYAQLPLPVIFKPLQQPTTDIYELQGSGLVALSNSKELQFWDASTKAYYGSFGVLPITAYNCFIRVVEYIPTNNTVAVVWEEITFDNTTNQNVYKDFLTVINLTNLLIAKPVERNGMKAFIEYKYGKQTILPDFKNSENIYQCYYNSFVNTFYTIDRAGEINVYEKAVLKKTIFSKIETAKLFISDSAGKILYITSSSKSLLQQVNVATQAIKTIEELQPTKTCYNNWGSNFNSNYSTTYIAGVNSILITDSTNRVQIFDFIENKKNKIQIPIVGVKYLGLKFNYTDSTFLGLMEVESNNCMRVLFSYNLKTSVAHIFNGGTSLQISSSFYGSGKMGIKYVVSGISEHEIDLSNLTDKTNSFLVSSTEKNLKLTGKWEKGYVSVFVKDSNTQILKVNELINDKMELLYKQSIHCKPDEDFVAMLPKQKWYVACTKSAVVYNPATVNKLRIYDSTGKQVYATQVTQLLQVLNYYPYEQQMFSRDGKYFLIKEVIGIYATYDSIRLRVVSLNGFKTLADIKYKELSGAIAQQRHTAFITDSTATLYYTAIANNNGRELNYLHKLKFTSNTEKVITKSLLQIEGFKDDLPCNIKSFKISGDEQMIMWIANGKDTITNPSVPIFYQAIRGTKLNNTKDQWGFNLPPFPEIKNVLLFNDFIAIQFSDYFQMYKWANNSFQYFLTTIPVYNEKTAESSTLFVSFDKSLQGFNYYEKTGNEDCISFKVANHSFKRSLFDLTFNRPDLVLQKIPNHNTAYDSLYKKAVLKRSERVKNKLQNFNPATLPTVKIKNTSYVAGRFKMAITINSTQPIVAINTYINGCLRTRKTNLQMEFAEVEYNLFEQLNNGENSIEIVVINKDGIESLPYRLTQLNTKKQEKPNLHVLVVSVSNYDRQNAFLPNATKDGRDIYSIFSAQTSDTFFNQIMVDTLFDKAASQSAIQNWLKQKKEVEPNDYVIVFYSGHGLLDNEKNLHLATSKTGFEKTESTINFTKTLAFLDAIPARQRLFLIDACHSGNLDKDMELIKATNSDSAKTVQKSTIKYKASSKNIFEEMQNIFSFSETGNGTVVFSASGGIQVAYESAALQNGYFTYALKEALQQGKAEPAQNGALWLTQLVKYTTKRVLEISNGQQKPNLRISHPDINWRIR